MLVSRGKEAFRCLISRYSKERRSPRRPLGLLASKQARACVSLDASPRVFYFGSPPHTWAFSGAAFPAPAPMRPGAPLQNTRHVPCSRFQTRGARGESPPIYSTPPTFLWLRLCPPSGLSVPQCLPLTERIRHHTCIEAFPTSRKRKKRKKRHGCEKGQNRLQSAHLSAPSAGWRLDPNLQGREGQLPAEGRRFQEGKKKGIYFGGYEICPKVLQALMPDFTVPGLTL